jgi:hypothetical protein
LVRIVHKPPRRQQRSFGLAATTIALINTNTRSRARIQTKINGNYLNSNAVAFAPRALRTFGLPSSAQRLVPNAGANDQVEREKDFTARRAHPLKPSRPSQRGTAAGMSADGRRRNIGCGWWPIGSDADRDCAAGGRHF